MTQTPPFSSGPQISKVAASNTVVATWAIRAPGRKTMYPGSSIRRSTARSGTTTPLGLPVEPEVNIT
jgi:hypothetical protein